MAAKDLRMITDGWPYVPGQISVRKVRGADHRVKIQMRIDLGVLQMEVSGRPDGYRPFDYESLLEYYKDRVEAYRRRNGTDLGFTLDPDECREIREESVQYYQRYLANFVLEDYEAVTRDTKRNLDVLDLCVTYASEDEDRYALESYRPYIVMMYRQSKALLHMRLGAYRAALVQAEAGIKTIRDFFRRNGHPKAYRISGEVQVLRTLRREIKRHLPVDPVRQLKRKLKRAIDRECYEDAARLRDELESLQETRSHRSD